LVLAGCAEIVMTVLPPIPQRADDQSKLLTVLYESQSGSDIFEQVKELSDSSETESWFKDDDPNMLELAAGIFQKWGCPGGA
jgi:hypothetical protein